MHAGYCCCWRLWSRARRDGTAAAAQSDTDMDADMDVDTYSVAPSNARTQSDILARNTPRRSDQKARSDSSVLRPRLASYYRFRFRYRLTTLLPGSALLPIDVRLLP